MSNVESSPQELACPSNPGEFEGGVEILSPRLVPLGGPRAMTVRRTLPQRCRSLISAWCFVDHYGHDDVANSPGKAVPPHPHTGLQTISWLFSGRSATPTARGTMPRSTVLHGVQLWAALPVSARGAEPGFHHYSPVPPRLPGAVVSVFMGQALGARSPVETFTPMVGAEITLDAGASLTLDLAPGFEHGFLVDAGSLTIAGSPVAAQELAYLGLG